MYIPVGTGTFPFGFLWSGVHGRVPRCPRLVPVCGCAQRGVGGGVESTLTRALAGGPLPAAVQWGHISLLVG